MKILGPISVNLSPPNVLQAVIPVPPAAPPAPPLPGHWPVQSLTYLRSRMEKPALATAGLGLHRDTDSGLWSSLGEDLPGCGLSDSEFQEEFSTDSRRGSADSALAIRSGIPTPPPVPPLPSYLQNLPPSPAIRAASPLRIESQELMYGITLYDDLDTDYDDYDDYVEESTCMVCYAPSGTSRWRQSRRLCCNRGVCRECMVNMVHAKIGLEGLVYMECPNPDCDVPMSKSEIMDLLSGNNEMKEKYERMRLDVEGSDTKKACPHCSLITDYEVPSKRKKTEEDVKITCAQCRHDWCFDCQAPWHAGVTCKQFKKGDKHFHKWTKGQTTAGVANCQKCPTCRVFIQRSTGCDHMTCNRCDTHFCYKCGGRFMDIPGLGDHYDRVSVFGCRNNYLADQPIKRKAIRGGYLGAKVAMLTGYPVLFVAGVAVVATVGVVVLPIYGGYRFYKYRKNINRIRQRRRRHF